MPVPMTRMALVKMAMGMAEKMMTHLFRGEMLMKKAYATARARRETSDRMPLQASATSRVVAGNMMMFPSRSTVIPIIFMNQTEAFVTKSFKGKARAS